MRRARTLKRLPFLPLAGMLLVVLAVSAALWLVYSQAKVNGRVAHTLHVEVSITRILERARALESAHRGLLVRGNRLFMADMREAEGELWTEFVNLREQTRDN